jgi:hypothetical protein
MADAETTKDRLMDALRNLLAAGDMIATGTSTDRDHYRRYGRAEGIARAVLAEAEAESNE